MISQTLDEFESHNPALLGALGARVWTDKLGALLAAQVSAAREPGAPVPADHPALMALLGVVALADAMGATLDQAAGSTLPDPAPAPAPAGPDRLLR